MSNSLQLTILLGIFQRQPYPSSLLDGSLLLGSLDFVALEKNDLCERYNT
jgi:hypothetical protein